MWDLFSGLLRFPSFSRVFVHVRGAAPLTSASPPPPELRPLCSVNVDLVDKCGSVFVTTFKTKIKRQLLNFSVCKANVWSVLPAPASLLNLAALVPPPPLF